MEKHWQQLTMVSALLLPLSGLFATVTAVRRMCYRIGLFKTVRPTVPVVVVGNLTVGGTGKTPTVIWLVQALRQRGLNPGVVSRGYLGSGQISHVLPDSDPGDIGDEPALIATRSACPVWVGRDRSATVLALVSRHPEVNVVVADDGLQHYRMGRDCEIVLIDGERGFGNRLLLPAGPLREPVSRLRTVDAVVINGPGQQEGDATRFRMTLDGSVLRNLLNPGSTVPAVHFQGQRVHAVAGIGNPARFFSHLRQLGLSFLPHPFPDHHAFSSADLEFADADAVIMTEKDAIKCSRFARDNWWALPVDAQIDPALADLVIRKIASHSGR